MPTERYSFRAHSLEGPDRSSPLVTVEIDSAQLFYEAEDLALQRLQPWLAENGLEEHEVDLDVIDPGVPADWPR